MKNIALAKAALSVLSDQAAVVEGRKIVMLFSATQAPEFVARLMENGALPKGTFSGAYFETVTSNMGRKTGRQFRNQCYMLENEIDVETHSSTNVSFAQAAHRSLDVAYDVKTSRLTIKIGALAGGALKAAALARLAADPQGVMKNVLGRQGYGVLGALKDLNRLGTPPDAQAGQAETALAFNQRAENLQGALDAATRAARLFEIFGRDLGLELVRRTVEKLKTPGEPGL